MLNLQNYGSSSESDSESEKNEELPSHLKPIDKTLSIATSMAIEAAPIVVPVVRFYYS